MRMLGRKSAPWCPICRAPAGPDCPDNAKTKRQIRRMENMIWRRDYTDEELYPELEEDDGES